MEVLLSLGESFVMSDIFLVHLKTLSFPDIKLKNAVQLLMTRCDGEAVEVLVN